MRALIVTLLLLLIAVPASAQITTFTTAGPGGVIYQSNATVTVANSSTLNTLFTFAVPAGYAQRNGVPLHLKLIGRVSTNVSSGGVGVLNIASNYGGSTATLSISNAAIDAQLSNAPFAIDVRLVPQTATNNRTQYLQGRFAYQSATAGTEKAVSAQVLGTTSMNTSQTWIVTLEWASASTTNTISVQSATVVLGE